MKKDWTKKCTCENFQQNEDCEHIGNKVLEEVGMQVEDSMGSYHIANTHIEEVDPKIEKSKCCGERPSWNFSFKSCSKCGKKFEPVLMEEVGLGVGDKDCPDCLPYDGGEEGGCAKHYIQDGDRHDRIKKFDVLKTIKREHNLFSFTQLKDLADEFKHSFDDEISGAFEWKECSANNVADFLIYIKKSNLKE